MSIINKLKIFFDFKKYLKSLICRNLIWMHLLPIDKFIYIFFVFLIIIFEDNILLKYRLFIWFIYFIIFICNKRKVYSTRVVVIAYKIMTSF